MSIYMFDPCADFAQEFNDVNLLVDFLSPIWDTVFVRSEWSDPHGD